MVQHFFTENNFNSDFRTNFQSIKQILQLKSVNACETKM